VARVLVVEDEERYREVVCRYLTLQGHEVHDTADAERAIVLGLEHQPDALVADWMLRNSVHGLHVAEALRVADPGLHTVVVTGFPASDVTVDAARVGISEILEKPFDVEALGRAVVHAAVAPDAGPDGEEEVVGLLLVDASGAIVRGNRAASTLLAELPGGAAAARMSEVVSEARLAEAATGWIEAPTESGGLWLRVRKLDSVTVVLLCAGSQGWRREDPRVRMLLGLPLGGAIDGVFRDAMLLVDDSASVRDTFVAQLAHRRCSARAAGRHGDALDLFRADPTIRVVILDWAMPGEDLRNTVAQLREIRPEVRLVGTSGGDRTAEFAELGIGDFLLKPWTVAGELATLLGDEVSSRGE